MKNWILKTWMFDWARRIGEISAFAAAHRDILETMKDDLDKQAEELANKKLADLLSVVDPALIVSADPRTKQLLIGGEKPDEGRLNNLKAEAEFILQSDLWKLIYETPKAIAERAMFMDDGVLPSQLLKGRAILFTLATQKKLVDLFKSKISPLP